MLITRDSLSTEPVRSAPAARSSNASKLFLFSSKLLQGGLCFLKSLVR